jgi:hypothetical protein
VKHGLLCALLFVLLAPIVLYVGWELGIALFAAALLSPKLLALGAVILYATFCDKT